MLLVGAWWCEDGHKATTNSNPIDFNGSLRSHGKHLQVVFTMIADSNEMIIPKICSRCEPWNFYDHIRTRQKRLSTKSLPSHCGSTLGEIVTEAWHWGRQCWIEIVSKSQLQRVLFLAVKSVKTVEQEEKRAPTFPLAKTNNQIFKRWVTWDYLAEHPGSKLHMVINSIIKVTLSRVETLKQSFGIERTTQRSSSGKWCWSHFDSAILWVSLPCHQVSQTAVERSMTAKEKFNGKVNRSRPDQY